LETLGKLQLIKTCVIYFPEDEDDQKAKKKERDTKELLGWISQTI